MSGGTISNYLPLNQGKVRALDCINSFPNVKFLDWSKFKAFADDKIKVTEKLQFVYGRAENIVGKRENAGYHHFLLSKSVFKGLIHRVVKSQDCAVKS